MAISKQARHFYEFGPFRLDAAERVLLRDGLPVALTPKVFELLHVLVENSGHIVEKEELLKRVWAETIVEEGSINRNVSTLRKVLGEDPGGQRYIETIPKRGYRFIAPVREGVERPTEVFVETHTRARLIEEEELTVPPESEPEWAPAALTGSRKDDAGYKVRTALLVTGVGVLAAGLLAVAGYLVMTSRSDRGAAGAAFRSVAVLPFKIIGGASDDEYLGLGMADALITKLSNLRQIAVRPTSAVRKYGAIEPDPVAAGRELQVDSVLEGSVQKSGEQIRVTVQLVSVRDGTPLWAGKFDERFTGIFTVQDTISERLADALALKLTSEQRQRLTKRSTQNPEAYTHYLKGRYHFSRRTDEGLKRSIEYFNRALEIEPGYALAYAGLSDSYIYLHDTDLDPASAGEVYGKARSAATKALEMDDALGEAHGALALVKMRYEGDWPGAEAAFKRALELDPNSAETHHQYSHYLVVVGRIEEALTESLRALDLDPLSLPYNGHLGWYYYYARSPDQAIAACQKTLELDPNYPPAHQFLGRAYAQKGRYEEAIAALQKAVSLFENNPEAVAYLGHAYAVAGKRKEAQNLIRVLAEMSKKRYVSTFDTAIIHVGLGEKEKAIDGLEKAYGDADKLLYIKTSPLFDGLRSEPRFQDLLRRVGLIPGPAEQGITQ